MQKAVDYRIIGAGDPRDLASLVRQYMRDGMQPVGGMVYVSDPPPLGDKYLQTMVEYEAEQ